MKEIGTATPLKELGDAKPINVTPAQPAEEKGLWDTIADGISKLTLPYMVGSAVSYFQDRKLPASSEIKNQVEKDYKKSTDPTDLKIPTSQSRKEFSDDIFNTLTDIYNQKQISENFDINKPIAELEQFRPDNIKTFTNVSDIFKKLGYESTFIEDENGEPTLEKAYQFNPNLPKASKEELSKLKVDLFNLQNQELKRKQLEATTITKDGTELASLFTSYGKNKKLENEISQKYNKIFALIDDVEQNFDNPLKLNSLYTGITKEDSKDQQLTNQKLEQNLETIRKQKEDFVKTFSLPKKEFQTANKKHPFVNELGKLGYDLMYYNNPVLSDEKKAAFEAGVLTEFDMQNSVGTALTKLIQDNNTELKYNKDLLEKTKKSILDNTTKLKSGKYVYTEQDKLNLAEANKTAAILQKAIDEQEDWSNFLNTVRDKETPIYKQSKVERERLTELGNKYPILSTLEDLTGNLWENVKEIPEWLGLAKATLFEKESKETTLRAMKFHSPDFKDISPMVRGAGEEQLQPLKEASAIQLFNKQGEKDFDYSWRPILYQSGKMGAEMIPFIVGQFAAQGIKFGIGRAISSQIGKIGLEATAAEAGTLGGISEISGVAGVNLGENLGLRALSSTAKEGLLKGTGYIAARSLGIAANVIPSTMYFGGEMFKNYIDAGFTPNQATKLSLLASAAEGATESLFSNEMEFVRNLTKRGMIKNTSELAENQIYRDAIVNLFKTKFTERQAQNLYNYVFKPIVKAGGDVIEEGTEEAVSLAFTDFVVDPYARNFKGDYDSGEKFDLENLANTYLSTAATMGLMTGGSVVSNIKNRRAEIKNAQYIVAASPSKYIQTTLNLLEKGHINNDEAQRRINVINKQNQSLKEAVSKGSNIAEYKEYSQDEKDQLIFRIFSGLNEKQELSDALTNNPSEKEKAEIVELFEKTNNDILSLLSDGLYKSQEERDQTRSLYLDSFFTKESINEYTNTLTINSLIKKFKEEKSNEANLDLQKKYEDKINLLEQRKVSIENEIKEANKTPEQKAADSNQKGVIKLTTKSGDKDLVIGQEYQLSRTLENKKDGTIKFNYPKFTIIQDNGDGTVKISAKNKKGQDVIFDRSKEELSKYDIFSKEEIQKDPIKSFYVKNADKKMKLKLVAQNKNKHKAFKGLSEVEGILSLQGNDLYLHFNDKNGVAQSVKLGGGDIFGYGKYKEKKQGLLKPVQKMFRGSIQAGQTTNITEEDLAQFEQMTDKELEEYEKTKTEDAEKYFKSQLEAQGVRRRAYLLEYLEEIRKPISKIENEINKAIEELQKIKEAAPLLREAAKVSNIVKGLKPIKGVLTKEEVANLKTKTPYEISQALIQKAKDIEQGVSPIIKDLENDYNNLLSQKASKEAELQDEIDFVNGLMDEEFDFESTIIDQLKEDREELKKELERNNDLIENFKNIIDNLRKIANAAPKVINDIYTFLTNEEESTYSPQQLQEMFDDLTSKISNLEDQNQKIQEKIDRYTEAHKFLKRKSKQFKAEKDAKKLEEYKQEIFDTQNEFQSQSETLSPEDAEKAKKEGEFTLQPHISKTYVATTSENVFDKDGNIIDPKNDNNVLRLQRFLEKVEKVTDYVLLVITKDNAAQYGLQDIIFEQGKFTNDGKEENTDIKVVFARKKDGKYFFPDQNLVESETPNPNQVIYTSIKTTSEVNAEGKKRYHVTEGVTAEQEKDIVRLYQNVHKDYRQNIINLIKSNEVIELPITGISRGIEVEIGDKKEVAVSEVLPEGTDLSSRPLIVIPENPAKPTDKTGKVQFQGTNENVNMPLGIPMLSFGQHLKFLNSRKFTPEEVENLMKIIVFMYKQSITNKGKLNKDIIKYLSKVLYWRNPDYVSKATNKKQTSPIGKYQIWYDKNTKSLRVGRNTGQIPFKFETPEDLLKLKAFLSEVYHNIDIVPLELNKTGGVLEPYVEIISIDKKGNLKTREWPSYQEYLLSNKNPEDGSPRTPILTVSQHTALTPTQSRYVTFSNSSNDKVTDFIKEKIATPVNPTQKQAEKATPAPAKPSTETKEVVQYTDIPNPDWANIPPTKEGEVYRYTVSEDNYIEFTFGENRNPYITFDSKKEPQKIHSKVKDLINGKITKPKGTLSKGVQTKVAETKNDKAPAAVEKPKAQRINFSTVKKEEDPTQNSAADIPSYGEFEEVYQGEFEPEEPTQKPTATDLPEFENFDEDDDYRVAQNRKYIRENLKEAEQWFKSRFPQIDFRIIVGLINGKAWGQTLNAAVILSNFAEEGTVYHEAFEVVYKHFLTKAQKKALLKEFRNRKGTFKDYKSGKTIKYSEATDFQIKEQIAEEYREYALTGKKWEGEYRKNGFFRKVWDIITGIFSNTDTIQEVFDKINEAAYKDKAPKLDNINSSKDQELYRLSITNPLYLNDLLNSVTNIMFSKLYKANKNILEVFKSDFSLFESYKEVKDQLNSHFGGQKALDLIKGKTPDEFVKENLNKESLEKIKNIFKETNSNLPARLKLEHPNPVDFLNKLYDLINSYEYIDLNWQYIQEKHRDYLAKYKVEFEEAEVEEDDIETDNRSNWVEDVSINAKENANTEIKLLIATLLEREYEYREVNGIVLAPTIRTKTNSLYLNNLVDYNKTIISLLYNLSDATNFDEMVENLKQLKLTNPSIEGLLDKLKVDYPQNELTAYDISLRNKFIKSLNKMRAVYNKLIVSGENLDGNFLDINQSESANVIKRKWLENIKTSDLVKVVNDKVVFDKANLKTKQIVNLKDAINFLNELGFGFDISLGFIQREDESTILKAATDLYTTLTRQDTEFVVADNAQTKVPLNTLSNLYTKYTGNLPEPQHLNIEGKPVYNILLHNFIGIVIKNFNRSKTLDEFFQRIPQLNNEYSKNSQILKSAQFFSPDGKRRDTIELHIIDGTESDNSAVPSSKLSPVDKILQEFASNLQGIYHILTPADTKTEWAWKLGHFISQIQAKDNSLVLSKFKEYLKAEIELVQDFQENGSSILYLNEKNKETGKFLGEELRLFQSIINFDLNITPDKSADEIIAENKNRIDEAITEYMNTSVSNTFNFMFSNGAIRPYKEITEDGERLVPNRYTIAFVPNSFTQDGLTEEEIEDLIKWNNINYQFNIFEQYKLLWGDPAQWKDITKRVKSFTSGRELSISGEKYFNDFHSKNSNMLSVDEESVEIKPNILGYNIYDDNIRTLVYEDLDNVVSINANEIIEKHRESAAKILYDKSYSELTDEKEIKEVNESIAPITEGYEKINEADAQAWAFPQGYKQIKQRSDSWSDADEEQFQYDMALMRKETYEKYPKYRSRIYPNTEYGNKLRAVDQKIIDKGNPYVNRYQRMLNGEQNVELPILNVLKPIYTGFKNSNPLTRELDKMSIAYLTWNTVKGTNAEEFFIEHVLANTTYVKTQSANKSGTEEVTKLYNQDGSVNTSFKHQTIDFKWFGIQVETITQKDSSTLGTQLTKDATLNLMNEGVPVDYKGTNWNSLSEDEKLKQSTFYKLVKGNDNYLKYLKIQAKNEIFAEFGIVQTEKGFKFKNVANLYRFIQRELRNRNATENLKEALQINFRKGDEFMLPFDLIVGGEKIEALMSSVIDKRVLRPKMFGGQMPQISSALFEKVKRSFVIKNETTGKWEKVNDITSLSKEQQAKAKLTSNELSFYIDEDGKRVIEVYVPYFFRESLKEGKVLDISKIDPELLYGIGFRIPTQEINAVEHIKIKGFLPVEYGNSIVVPSEITTKAGSDFDIDKLNIYLYNYRFDENGIPKKIKYDADTSQKAIERRYNEKYRSIERFANWFKSEQGYRAFRASEITTGSAYALNIPEGSMLFDFIFEELSIANPNINIDKSYNDNIKKLEQLVKDEKELTPSLQEFSKLPIELQNSKQALENKYVDNLRDILQLKENYLYLTTPNSAKLLQDQTKQIDALYKEDKKTKSLTKFLDRISNGLERYAFQVGKDAVGIAAVNQASHAISQKIGLNYTVFDPQSVSGRIQFNFKLNKKVLPNGKIIYSLSSVYSQDHKVISQVLSGFINAYVDIAKDPYIIRINGGITSASAYLTAVRLGIPLSTIVRWFNQPIIREYIALKEKNKSILADASNSKMLPWELVEALVSKYGAIAMTKTDEYTDQELESYITEYVDNNKNVNETSEEFKNNQVNLLMQFRELEKVSGELFNFYQGISYDTARTASHESFRIKFAQTRKALNGLFSPFVAKALNDTFVGAIFESKLEYLQATRQFYLSENDYARQVLNPLLVNIFNTVGKKADIEKAAMDMRRHFITYLIQTIPINFNNKTFILTDLIDDLILGERNIVTRLKRVQKEQKSGKLDPNIFIKYLQGIIPTVLFKNKGDQSPIHSTRLVSKPKEKLQQDLFTDAINQLNQSDALHNFVNDLILSQLLQSGVLITPLSFSEIIPNDVFQSISSQIKNYFDTVNPTELLSNFEDSYLRNKWKDSNIVPTGRKKNEKSGTKYLKPVFRAFSTNFLIYPVTNEDRSYMSIPKESKYKYIKIRTQKEKLSEFEQMDKKAAGDFSNIETIIYKRFEVFNEEKQMIDVPLVAERDKRGNLHFKVLFYPADKYGNGIYAVEHYSESKPSKYFKPVSKTPNTYEKIKNAIEDPEMQSIVTMSQYWLSDFKPQMQQYEDVEDIDLGQFEKDLVSLPDMILSEKEYTVTEPTTTTPTVGAVKPENISSKGSEFAKKLTNVGNTVGLTYKGKQYVNSEHAYQTWKSGEFNQAGYNLKGGKVRGGKIGDTFSIMTDILTEKLKQHPELVQGINERGGIAYIEQSTHNVIGDKFWESTGQNKFIEALAQAYKNVQPTTQPTVQPTEEDLRNPDYDPDKEPSCPF